MGFLLFFKWVMKISRHAIIADHILYKFLRVMVIFHLSSNSLMGDEPIFHNLRHLNPFFSSLSALKLVKYLLQTTNLEIPWFLATSVFFLIFRKIIIFIPLIYYVIKHTIIFLGYISRPSLVDKMYLSLVFV